MFIEIVLDTSMGHTACRARVCVYPVAQTKVYKTVKCSCQDIKFLSIAWAFSLRIFLSPLYL